MKIFSHIRNVVGWSTNRKLVVIESDDWGSMRMPSMETHARLKEGKLDPDQGNGFRYNRFDHLAGRDDFSSLFEVLTSVKDKNDQYPVLTAMTLVANPDFKKIRENNFQTYFFESVLTSLDRCYPSQNIFGLWKEGMSMKVFHPEYHGREHLNIASWMRALQQNDSQTRLGFDHQFWGFRHPEFKPNYQAAFDFWDSSELTTHKLIIKGGLALFQEIFGYQASHFAAPNGYVHGSLLKHIAEWGIKSIVTSRKNRLPKGEGKYKTGYRYPGQKNIYGQRYVIRNCFFEPNASEIDWVDHCLKDIEIAFKWKKPAIIGNHRTCFIGKHNVKNRDKGLKCLRQLLKTIVRKWPDVEFVTSTHLVKMMNKKVLYVNA